MTICYWESLDQPMASIYIDSSSIYSWVRRACFRPRLLPGGFPEIWCIFRLIGTRENPFIIYIQTFDHCCHGSPCAKLVWSSFEWQGYVPRGERHGTTRMPNSWNPGWKKWSAVLAPVHASTIMSPYSRRYWICDLILTVWFSQTRKEHRSIRSILSYIRWIFSKLFQTFITIYIYRPGCLPSSHGHPTSWLLGGVAISMHLQCLREGVCSESGPSFVKRNDMPACFDTVTPWDFVPIANRFWSFLNAKRIKRILMTWNVNHMLHGE